MLKRRGLGGGAAFAVALLVAGTARAQAPTALVGSGANLVAYAGVSNVLADDPGVFWYTPPSCSGVGTIGDSASPASIFRGTTDGASPRAILTSNPSRAYGTCNPYRLISNIAVDTNSLYFVDNLGPSGHFALQRRSRNANASDPSTMLVDLGTTMTSVEVHAEYPTVLFAVLRVPGSQDLLRQYLKSNGDFMANLEVGNPGAIRNIQYDGRYLYWLNGTELRADDTTNGAKFTVVPSGVSTYLAEGYYHGQGCFPGRCDPDVAFVLYGGAADYGCRADAPITGSVHGLGHAKPH
jgi:hypothetical protein